jgi:hypothetical protein
MLSGSLASLTPADQDALAAEAIRLVGEANAAAGSATVVTHEMVIISFREGSVVISIEFRSNSDFTQASVRAIVDGMRARHREINVNGVSYTVIAVTSTVKTNNAAPDAAESRDATSSVFGLAILGVLMAFVVVGAIVFGCKHHKPRSSPQHAHSTKDLEAGRQKRKDGAGRRVSEMVMQHTASLNHSSPGSYPEGRPQRLRLASGPTTLDEAMPYPEGNRTVELASPPLEGAARVSKLQSTRRATKWQNALGKHPGPTTPTSPTPPTTLTLKKTPKRNQVDPLDSSV